MKNNAQFSADAVESTSALATQEIDELSQEVSFTAVSLTDMYDKASQLNDNQEALTLTPEYYKFKGEGEKVRAIFAGIINATFINKEATKNNGGIKVYQDQDAVVFITKDKKSYLHAGVSLVKGVKGFNIAPGTPIEITFVEKKGDVAIFTVGVLGDKK